RASVGVFQSGPLGAGLYAQTTWASGSAAHAYYGITPEQSAAYGLPAYNPGAGLLYTGFGLLMGLDLSKTWTIVGSAEARQVRGDARRSPVVERTSNYYL